MISRRSAMAGVLASVLVRADEPQTFILVPGAWHGGWAWDRVAKVLEASGHSVDAVTLPGVGSRRDEQAVTLETHVKDVVTRLENAARPVVLVGHSYAGVVVMPAAARVPKKVARLVLLDAFIVEPGQSMLSLMKPSYSESWRKKAKEKLVPPMLDAKAMGVTNEKDAAWVNSQLTPHPLATVEDAAQFEPKALEPLSKRYVWCAKYSGFKRYFERAKSLGWETRHVDAGHDAMIVAPNDVVAAIS